MTAKRGIPRVFGWFLASLTLLAVAAIGGSIADGLYTKTCVDIALEGWQAMG